MLYMHVFFLIKKKEKKSVATTADPFAPIQFDFKVVGQKATSHSSYYFNCLA